MSEKSPEVAPNKGRALLLSLYKIREAVRRAKAAESSLGEVVCSDDENLGEILSMVDEIEVYVDDAERSFLDIAREFHRVID